MEINVPASPFDEGMADTARGEHYNANPHISGTEEAYDWDEGWSTGRDENVEGLRK